MNDLAERALRGLDVARREVMARPMLALGVVGFAISCVIVVAGGQVAAAGATRPTTTWLGLADTHGVRPDNWVPGAVLLSGIVALVALWIFVIEFVRRHDPRESRVWRVAVAWGLPLALGPPLMGTSIQSYVAYGLLQRHGHDPYVFGPSRLINSPIVTAIDPAARGTPSSAGPLGTLVQHLAVSVSAGTTLGALLVLRALGVVVAVFIGRIAADLAGASRSRALTLTVLNPLLLLYVVSAARLDGLMIAFALAAIRAANRRSWLVSIALACLAGSVGGQAFVLVPVIVAVHLLGRRNVSTWLLVGRDMLVAAVTTAAAGLLVHNGFGWLWTVHNQFSTHTPFSMAGAVARMLTPIVRGASYDDLADGARIATIIAMVCTIGYLVITARQRALERTAGYALLAVGLLSPVLYPWYALWGAICLAPNANGSRRTVVVALCAAGCVLMPPGFSATTTNVLAAIALAAVAIVFAAVLSTQRTRSDEPTPVSAGTA